MEEESVEKIAYLLMIVFTVIIAAFGPLMLCVTTTTGNLDCTGTEAVIARDFQLNGNQTGVVYKSYPLEWPFMSGLFIQVVNSIANLQTSTLYVQLTQLYVTPILLGLISVGIIMIYYWQKVDWKRCLMFYVLVPINLGYGWLETLQMFLFLAGLTVFGLRREGGSDSKVTSDSQSKIFVAGILLGLASGVKYLPLLTLPMFVQKTDKKVELVFTWIAMFVSGMIVEIGLNPTNFLRSTSFYSGYGVEGSWLGLLFGNVIDYGHQETWYIGTSTAIHLPQVYQNVSIVLLTTWLTGTYKSNFGLVEKCILVFAGEFIFLWLSAPQFLLNIAVLLPVSVIALRPQTVVVWWTAGLMGFFPFIVYWAERSPFTVAYYFQVGAEILMVVFVLISFRMKSVGTSDRSATPPTHEEGSAGERPKLMQVRAT